MMPKNSAIRSFFCKCLINWTLNLLSFFGGYYTIRYDEISSSPLSLPSRPQMARWLEGLGVYPVPFVSPRFLDAWNFIEVGKIRDIWDIFRESTPRSHVLTILGGAVGGPLMVSSPP
jgi:hypothetical protein